MPERDALVVGAGPYGLAAATHLRAAGVSTLVLGCEMSYWSDHMPRGMLLRSPWHASHIASPGGRFSIGAFEAERGTALQRPLRVEDFVSYGCWYQRRALPDLGRRRVTEVRQSNGRFEVRLSDGESIVSSRVVLATGPQGLEYRPPPFDRLPRAAACHSSEVRDPSSFSGARVLVVGGGQSAIEWAALLKEAGAGVHVLVRAPAVHWLSRAARLRRLLGPILYSPTDVGPAGVSKVVSRPDLFRRLPAATQQRLTERSLRPAAADWLMGRMRDVPITSGRTALHASENGGSIEVHLDDGTKLTVDRVVLGTGFRPDVGRHELLSVDTAAAVRSAQGYPVLGPGFETTVPGLHLIGTMATFSFGPVMRFVAGTWYTAPALARHIAGDAGRKAR